MVITHHRPHTDGIVVVDARENCQENFLEKIDFFPAIVRRDRAWRGLGSLRVLLARDASGVCAVDRTLVSSPLVGRFLAC